jgi:hypothetical protein
VLTYVNCSQTRPRPTSNRPVCRARSLQHALDRPPRQIPQGQRCRQRARLSPRHRILLDALEADHFLGLGESAPAGRSARVESRTDIFARILKLTPSLERRNTPGLRMPVVARPRSDSPQRSRSGSPSGVRHALLCLLWCSLLVLTSCSPRLQATLGQKAGVFYASTRLHIMQYDHEEPQK